MASRAIHPSAWKGCSAKSECVRRTAHFLGSRMSLYEALDLFRSLDRVTAEYE